MIIQLTRPLVFLDIESTGTDRENDRIIELCLIKIFPDGNRETKTNRYNPGVPIPASSSEVHGIKDEDVKDMPFFKQHAKGITEYLTGCDLAGFNSNNFDIPMLFNELLRSGQTFNYKDCHMVDVGNIFKIQEQRTLSAAVKFYCGYEHEGAHGAQKDTEATENVFLEQLRIYEELPQTIAELALYSNYGNPILDLSGKFTSKDGVILLNFGKYRGEPAKDHIDFIEWMLYKANFNTDTNKVCRELIEDYNNSIDNNDSEEIFN